MQTVSAALAYTVETGLTAPTGQPAVKATCRCAACNGKAALVRTAYADQHNLSAQTKDAYTHVHNLVQMAHSPLSRAPQMQANGPWRA